MRAAGATHERVVDCHELLTPCKVRQVIPVFLEGVYEYMAANRAIIQDAWRGCRSSDEALRLADVFDSDIWAEAARLQLEGQLFFAEGANDAYVLHLKDKACGQKRGQESTAPLPAPAESEPGKASSDEENDYASWITRHQLRRRQRWRQQWQRQRQRAQQRDGGRGAGASTGWQAADGLVEQDGSPGTPWDSPGTAARFSLELGT